MEPLHLPFFRVDRAAGRYAVFLPGFRPDEVDELDFDYDADEEILRVLCRYVADEHPKTEVYPIAITELNRDQFEAMEKLVVFNPREHTPEELSEDPQVQQKLRDFFEQLENLTRKQPLEETPPEE